MSRPSVVPRTPGYFTIRSLCHGLQLYLELQVTVRWYVSSSLGSIGKGCRDPDDTFTTDFHLLQSLFPSLDHFTLPESEGESFRVPIELLLALVQSTDVRNVNHLPRGSGWSITWNLVDDLQLFQAFRYLYKTVEAFSDGLIY